MKNQVSPPARTMAPPVGGGMLPGAPVEEEYQYTRRERPPEPGRTNRTGTYVLLALAILLVAGLVAYTISKLGGGGAPVVAKIPVPSVVDQNVDDAKKQLTDKGFTNVVVQTQNHDEPKDTVFAQDPVASTSILPSDKITLSVSTGPGQVAVPPLENLTQDQAVQKLRDAGLTLGGTTPVDDPNHKKDQVVSSDPAAGTSVEKGSAVKLSIATGFVQVPSLKNKAYQTAIAALAKLNLNPDTKFVDAPPGGQANIVQATDPGAGTRVGVGSTVTLTVTREATPTPSVTPSESPTPSTSPTPSP
jgi:serine/threonine-protein kinase